MSTVLSTAPKGRPLTSTVLDQYGEDRLFEDLYGGLTMAELASMLELSSTGRIYTWLYQTPERKARFKAFRLAMADQLVDEAIDIADEMDTNNGFAPVVKAKERIGIRKWTASAWNKETYGNQQISQLVTNLSIGQLHLQAVKDPNNQTPDPRVKSLPPVPDEIVVELPPSEGPE